MRDLVTLGVSCMLSNGSSEEERIVVGTGGV